jgi:hypothetical protein
LEQREFLWTEIIRCYNTEGLVGCEGPQYKISLYEKRFSAAFQLITSQMALKYSALRFWYCKLEGTVSIQETIIDT